MNILVRSMTLADCDAVIDLFDALDAYHREHLPWLFHQPKEQPRARQFFEDLLSDNETEVLVAETDRVVGLIHISLFNAPDFPIFVPQLRVAINNIFVNPAHRRSGIASLLIQNAEAWAKAKGAVGVDLNVYEFNETAQRLFSSMGFSTLSRRLSKALL